MINLQAIMAVVGITAAAIGYLYVKSVVQQRLLNANRKQMEQIKQEAAAIAKELEDAEKRKNIQQATQRLNADGVDQPLHDKGYYRDN